MNMKRVLTFILAALMLLTFAACGSQQEDPVVEDPADGIETPDIAIEEEETAPTDGIETPDIPVEDEEPAGLQYVVTVTDEGGNPIENAMVQMCEGTNCVPAKTDAEGKAVFTVQAEADFEVKFMALPAGFDYTTEEQVFYFEAGAKEMTIVLKAVA